MTDRDRVEALELAIDERLSVRLRVPNDALGFEGSVRDLMLAAPMPCEPEEAWRFIRAGYCRGYIDALTDTRPKLPDVARAAAEAMLDRLPTRRRAA